MNAVAARLAALMLGTVMLVNQANAQAVYIDGTLDCGMWVSARTKSVAGYYEHYLLGFLNGLTLGHGVEFWRAHGNAKISRESIYLWLDQYCRENPLNDVLVGAVSLYEERSGWRP